ncbi:uncharacterized protein [Ranitomeya imitator]|uniref:uncharacterized protein n=1 Tax=Ranitomeya imitator TaxID=111125 RepID=UPI0037E963A2
MEGTSHFSSSDNMAVLELVVRFACIFALCLLVPWLVPWLIMWRRQRQEHEALLQDVALLMLENAELEEDTTHLIVENYKMSKNMAAIRQRNVADISEEHNQLFHDVALLTLENQQMQETSQRLTEENQNLTEENQNLLRTIAQLSERQTPAYHDDVLQLRSRVSDLKNENQTLKHKYETLTVQEHHRHIYSPARKQANTQCVVS